MTLRLQIVSSVAALKQIEPAWWSLVSAVERPTDTFAWYLNACAYAHPASDRLHVMTLWHGDRLDGVAPLVLTGRAGARRYEIIGTRTLYEPSAIPVRNDEAALCMARALAGLKRPLVLTRLTVAGEFNDRFMRCARGTGLVLSPRASGSPFIDLSSGWDSYYAGLPSRLKNVIRRGHRQLDKMSEVELQFVCPEPGQVGALLSSAFEVELRSWKRRSGSAVLLRSDLKEFFFHYAADLAERGELLVSFLRFKGEPIAMQVANVSGNAYWQLKIGYDEAYAKQLAGLQLQLETIKWAFQRGLARYEFLGTTEPWIREWTSTVHPYRTMLFYPFNPSGAMALARDSVLRVRNKVLTRRQRAA